MIYWGPHYTNLVYTIYTACNVSDFCICSDTLSRCTLQGDSQPINDNMLVCVHRKTLPNRDRIHIE